MNRSLFIAIPFLLSLLACGNDEGELGSIEAAGDDCFSQLPDPDVTLTANMAASSASWTFQGQTPGVFSYLHVDGFSTKHPTQIRAYYADAVINNSAVCAATHFALGYRGTAGGSCTGGGRSGTGTWTIYGCMFTTAIETPPGLEEVRVYGQMWTSVFGNVGKDVTLVVLYE